MATKQMGIKEKEQSRKNPVLGMISSEVAEAATEQNKTDDVEDNPQVNSEPETIESLKTAWRSESRIKNTINKKDTYKGYKSEFIDV